MQSQVCSHAAHLKRGITLAELPSSLAHCIEALAGLRTVEAQKLETRKPQSLRVMYREPQH